MTRIHHDKDLTVLLVGGLLNTLYNSANQEKFNPSIAEVT